MLFAVLVFGADARLFLLLAPVAIFVFGIALLIGHFLSQPLRDLHRKIVAAKQGNASVDFSPTGSLHEADLLAADFQNLCGTAKSQRSDLVLKQQRQTKFISDVAHELRTPLTAITGWSETLMYDEAIQGDSRRGVEIISCEAGRLTGMVEELLEFTRIRDGRFTLNLEEVDLDSLLEEVAFTYGELLKHDGIELDYEPAEEPLPPVTGDPARIKQVLLNILDNAAKYGRRGKKLELTSGVEGEYVRMSVRDHGPGFAEEDLPHVKERFYKGRGKERGSGIGLAVCDEIVTRHGGRLTTANAEGGGALVSVELPIKTQ